MSQLAEHYRVGEEEAGADVGAVGGEKGQGEIGVGFRMQDSGCWILDTG